MNLSQLCTKNFKTEKWNERTVCGPRSNSILMRKYNISWRFCYGVSLATSSSWYICEWVEKGSIISITISFVTLGSINYIIIWNQMALILTLNLLFKKKIQEQYMFHIL